MARCKGLSVSGQTCAYCLRPNRSFVNSCSDSTLPLMNLMGILSGDVMYISA